MEKIKIGQRVCIDPNALFRYEKAKDGIYEVYQINENNALIANEYGDIEVLLDDLIIMDETLELQAIREFQDAYINLRLNAINKLKRIGTIKWSVIKPYIIIKYNNNLEWQSVNSVRLKDENIMELTLDDKVIDTTEFMFSAWYEVELYRAILIYDT
jgi:hypothetical protein